MSLDKTGLESRIFDGLSITSRRKYIYACNMQTGVSRWSKHAIEDFGMPSEYFLSLPPLLTHTDCSYRPPQLSHRALHSCHRGRR